jgi:hypothetical protein
MNAQLTEKFDIWCECDRWRCSTEKFDIWSEWDRWRCSTEKFVWQIWG